MHIMGKFIEFPSFSCSQGKGIPGQQNKLLPSRSNSISAMSESDAQMVDCTKRNKGTELREGRLRCSELLCVCLSKPLGCLHVDGRKQVP